MPARRKHAPNNPSHGAPVAIQSERAALCAGLHSGPFAELITSELSENDFYSGQNQAVFRAIGSLLSDSLVVNPVSVSERSGVSINEVHDLSGEAGGLPTEQGLRTLCSELRRIGGLRRLYNCCANALSGLSKDDKLDAALETVERGLAQISLGSASQSKETEDGSDVLLAVQNDFLERYAAGGGVKVSTGIKALDRAIIGLYGGKVYVIGARPSMGKTALSDTLRRSLNDQGLGVITFSLEMPARELAKREIAFKSQVNLRKILSAENVSPEELERVKAVTVATKDMWHIDYHARTMAEIRRKVRQSKSRMAKKGIKLFAVILDYLQLMTGAEDEESRQRTISDISRELKLLSVEEDLAMIVLSQLNRSCEFRSPPKPIMSDIRESGAIEQDADQVWLLYRPCMYDHSLSPEDTELIIAKHRDGPTGPVFIRYLPRVVAFTDLPEKVVTDGNGADGNDSAGYGKLRTSPEAGQVQGGESQLRSEVNVATV